MTRAMLRLAIVATLASGCANSTQLVATWRDPNINPAPLHRTLAVYMTTDPGVRRMVEDKLAGRLPGGVASYRVLTNEEVANVDALRKRLAGKGFDGIVVMRPVGVTEQTTVVDGGYDIYGYWRYWGYAGEPVLYQTNTFYSVESTLYNFRTGKMEWMGRSQTINPKNANKLADYAVTFAVRNLERAGFIR